MKFNYKIIAKDEYDLRVRLLLAPDMDAFNGHFETLPILPAVAQLYIVEKIAQMHFVDLGSFVSMQQVKFMNLISSGGTIDINICFDPHKQLLTFAYITKTETSSKGKLQYSHNGKDM